MVEPRIYSAMCVTREDLNLDPIYTILLGPRSEQECPLTRIIYCSLLFRVLLNFAYNAQTCSPKFILWMNENLVVLKNVGYLTIYYVIVLSSVLFGYGTFFCINTIGIILWFYIYTNDF